MNKKKLAQQLHDKSGMNAPNALANWIGNHEANAANALAAVTRAMSKKLPPLKLMCSERENARILEATPSKPLSTDNPVREGARCRVVLITVGLGNKRDMNFYSEDAIRSAPSIFEGRPCYFDHPSESEANDIPERRVRQKIGYFKNCAVEDVAGVPGCVGELHFDLSEDGEQAYRKALTALHYKTEFPGFSSEYIGLSINANGDRERRKIQWQGETIEVNYVTRFTDAMSCDMVTTPARGGRILAALVESAAGAKKQTSTKNKEGGPMEKKLQAALAALKEAKEKNPDNAEIKRAYDEFIACLNEADKAAYEKKESKEAKCAKEEESEDESEDESEEESKQADDAGDDDKDDKEEEEESGDPADTHTVTVTKHKKTVTKTGKAATGADQDEDESMEAKRLAIKGLLSEAALKLDDENQKRVLAMSLKEAKEEIARLKKFRESVINESFKGLRVPAAHFGKTMESVRPSNGNANAAFADNRIDTRRA